MAGRRTRPAACRPPARRWVHRRHSPVADPGSRSVPPVPRPVAPGRVAPRRPGHAANRQPLGPAPRRRLPRPLVRQRRRWRPAGCRPTGQHPPAWRPGWGPPRPPPGRTLRHPRADRPRLVVRSLLIVLVHNLGIHDVLGAGAVGATTAGARTAKGSVTRAGRPALAP